MIGNLKDLIDLVHDLLIRVGMADWLADIISVGMAIVVLGWLVVYALHWLISKLLFWNNRRRLSRDLHPFYTKAEIDKATRYYIPTKYQDTAPSQADEPSRSFIDSPKAKLIPMMLKTAFQQDDSRYYLILADSGMGKTTFMMNLFLAYKNQWWWKQQFEIKLMPLGYPNILGKIEKIENPKNTILLLDALDEDIEAVKDYKKRLKQILDKTEELEFRIVVITCRTQFFPSEVEEPSKTGYFRYGTDGGEHFFRKAYVSVFDDQDINRYLRKRFKFWQWKDRQKARRIVQKSPNLMVRPMLLSHIQDLVGEEREYEYTYQIYEVLIQKWVERESNKPGIAEKYGSREKFQKLLLEFSQALAVDIYENRGKREGRLSIHKDEKIASFEGLQLADFEAVEETWGESDWRSRSLLNRDAGGRYKFSHKSIFEYFISINAIESANDKIDFDGMEAAKSFFIELFFARKLPSMCGEFFLKSSDTAYPLNKLSYKDIDKVTKIIILSASTISLTALKLIARNNIRELILFDKFAYKKLYNLYALMVFAKANNFYVVFPILRSRYLLGFINKRLVDFIEKDLEVANNQSLPPSFLQSMVVAAAKSIDSVWGTLIEQGIEIGKKSNKNYLTEKIPKILTYLSKYDLLELTNTTQNEEVTEFLTKTKNNNYTEENNIKVVSINDLENNIETLNELLIISKFLKECQALQAALPNVKIYY